MSQKEMMFADFIQDVYRQKRVSKQGNSYEVMVIVFDNSYELEVFLTNEQRFILSKVPLR
jgi:hypothetical protein